MLHVELEVPGLSFDDTTGSEATRILKNVSKKISMAPGDLDRSKKLHLVNMVPRSLTGILSNRPI
jgi:hypothetical protein